MVAGGVGPSRAVLAGKATAHFDKRVVLVIKVENEAEAKHTPHRAYHGREPLGHSENSPVAMLVYTSM